MLALGNGHPLGCLRVGKAWEKEKRKERPAGHYSNQGSPLGSRHRQAPVLQSSSPQGAGGKNSKMEQVLGRPAHHQEGFHLLWGESQWVRNVSRPGWGEQLERKLRDTKSSSSGDYNGCWVSELGWKSSFLPLTNLCLEANLQMNVVTEQRYGPRNWYPSIMISQATNSSTEDLVFTEKWFLSAT